MGFYDLILIPLLFGLVGFIEPCSLGINIIFLNRIKHLNRAKRIYETTIFTLVRGFFLALAGLTAAFVGNKFISIQSNLFIVLGTIYIILGILSIIHMYHPVFKSNMNLAGYFKNKSTIALGIVFGLIIPACAIGFVIALIGKAALAGNLFSGFVSLFVFGITLSFPLIIIGYFERSSKIIQKIFAKTKKIKWLAGSILISVGILTMLSSVWWRAALN